MEVIYICGSWSTEKLVEDFYQDIKRDIEERCEALSFSFYYDYFQPWQTQKVKSLVGPVLEKHDTQGNQVIVAGYSVGGLLARELSGKFKNAEVVGQFTVFCPHNLRKLFGYSETPVANHLDLVDPLDPLANIVFTYSPSRNQRRVGPYVHGGRNFDGLHTDIVRAVFDVAGLAGLSDQCAS